MDELLEQFLIERRELVQQAADELMALEKAPADRTRLDGAFRAIHTLKGSTALFELQTVTDLLHAAEDLLGALRGGARRADKTTIDAVFVALNQADRWIDVFEATGALPDGAARIGADLRARLTGDLKAPPNRKGAGGVVSVRYTPRPDAFFVGDDPLAIARGVPGLLEFALSAREPWAASALFDPFQCNLVVDMVSDAPRDRVEAALRLVADQVEITARDAEAHAGEPAAEAGAVRTLRVDSARLDALAEVVDELVVAKNALAHLLEAAEAGLKPAEVRRTLAAQYASFDRLTGRLHRTVMRARMAPLSGLWRRFPRLVRETATALGKSVELIASGETVEVDKALIDGLFEPLLHLVRNALDHGVGTPQERLSDGKPERARLELSARQAGERVIIEVADDGRGIDPAIIRHTAVDRGLIDAERAAALTDQQAIELILLPGFSTATEVGTLSGRGVGMDVVNDSVSRLGGRLSIATRRGEGTRMTLNLPLAMSLTQVMVVTAGGERFGVPLAGVVETARIGRDRVARVREGRAFILRDQTLPLVDLAALVGIEGAAPKSPDLTVLVVRHADELAAVAVDAIVDRIDVLHRPMAGLLSHMRGVAGATLLGDGEVLMLLDLEGLIG